MIIGVVNNKGGVLKTTLSTNLGACLSLDSKKTIIVDLDGQGNVIATFGKNPFNLEYTVMDFLKGDCTLDQAIVRERPPYLDILPGNDDLNFFDMYMSNGEVSQSGLKKLLQKLDEIYDYVIVDTPPNMSTVVATVLSTVNLAIIPFEPDQYATLGLRRIVNASKEFIIRNNPNMKVIAVPTKVNTRVTIHNDIINESIRPKLTSEGVYVTKNFISQSTKSTAAVGYERVPILFSVIKSKYQDEYIELKNEIIDYIKNNVNNNNNSVNSYNNNNFINNISQPSHTTAPSSNTSISQEPQVLHTTIQDNYSNNSNQDSNEPILSFNYSVDDNKKEGDK